MAMTTQEAYEQIRAHFSKPDAVFAFSEEEYDRAEGNGCVYRLGGNPKSPVRCAFGALIPDELYDPKFENVSAVELISGRPFSVLFYGVNRDFIGAAQDEHDLLAMQRATPETFVRALDKLADRHGLKVVKLKEDEEAH